MITKNVNDAKVTNDPSDDKCERFRGSFSIESMISMRNDSSIQTSDRGVNGDDTSGSRNDDKLKKIVSQNGTIRRNGNKVRFFLRSIILERIPNFVFFSVIKAEK